MSEVVVSGTFRSEKDLESAIGSLRNLGILIKDISFAQSSRLPGSSYSFRKGSRAGKAIAGGMCLGGLLGAVYFGLSFDGTVGYPNGELFLSGPWASALVGWSPGSIIGGFMGWLIGRRVPIYEATLSSTEKESPLLIGVNVDEKQADHVHALLEKEGASHVAKLDKKLQAEVGL